MEEFETQLVRRFKCKCFGRFPHCPELVNPPCNLELAAPHARIDGPAVEAASESGLNLA